MLERQGGMPVYSLSCSFSYSCLFLRVQSPFSPLRWVISSILRNTFVNQCSVDGLSGFPFWKMPTLCLPREI